MIIYYETEEGLIIDFDDERYVPAISISFQNEPSYNLNNKPVENFAKYFIKMKNN